MEYQILIGGVDYTDYVSLPLSDQLALDRSLDFGSLKLGYTDITEPIKPFTGVVIRLIWSESIVDELYYFVSNDTCHEIIESGKYTHTLLLIEQTKWLERFIGRTHPITQRLFNQRKVVAIVSKSGITDWKKELKLKTPLVASLVYFESPQEFFENMGIVSSNGSLEVYNPLLEYSKYTDKVAINLTKGQWSFVYWSGDSTSADTTRVSFYIDVVNESEKPVKKTITSEVNNILETIETLWINETPRFTFDAEQAEKYKDVVIPELTLTGTLFEQLSQIGNCIHAMPRLKNGAISFDEWGSEEINPHQKYKNNLFEDYISSVQSFDIEQYAVAIDSNVDNFVNSDEDNFGSIVEPYTDGFKTVRAEGGVIQLTDDNVVISTQYPIERILNVVVGYENENDFVGYDINSYIYSKVEYDLLSSYQDTYPSKAYALKYEVGQKNITGLNFKVPNPISPVFENYAIQNIINRVSSTASNISSLTKLQFRVTYIPIINGRARQYRSNIAEVGTNSTLAYNQSSQKINARAMGEAMKGAVEKLGNPELTKVYLLPQSANLYISGIKVGQKFDDDYYISIVKREFYPDFVKMEIGLSKNFNKLNEYVGVDSEIRFYEISEKQVVNTQILYEEFCIIGDELDKYDENVGASLGSIAKSMIGQSVEKISSVKAMGRVEKDSFQQVILPVVTYSVGNSVLLTFGYEDNYSAGTKVVTSQGSRIQEYVPYTDIWGELDNISLSYGGYQQNDNYTYNEVLTEGDSLPDATNIDYGEFHQDMHLDLIINKENRAVPTINYMLHFVTNRKDIVIGEGMAKYCYMNYGTDTNPVNIYVFDKRIGKYDYELTGGILIGSLSSQGYLIKEKQYIDFGALKSSVEGKSWAVVKEIDGKKYLLFGQNKDIIVNGTIYLPKLNFTHIIK